jgi:heptosyltransferase II
MKILVFTFCGLGDIVNFTPTIANLKANNPNCKIDVAVKNNSMKELLKNEKEIDTILIYPKSIIIDGAKGVSFFSKIKLIKEELTFLSKLKNEKYDLSLWAWPGETKRAAIVSFFSGAKTKIGFRYKLKGKEIKYPFKYAIDNWATKHSVDMNLESLYSLGYSVKTKKPKLTLTNEENKFALDFLEENKIKGKIIGIHPGSDSKSKIRRWPADNFVKLIELLKKQKGISVLLFLGPDEKELKEYFSVNLKSSANIISFDELRKTMSLIGKCDAFLTSDSGLGHIASAFDIPTVTIFGPANPIHTKPYNKGIVLTRNLSCSPCNYTKKGFACPYSQKCLTEITPNEVFKAIIGESGK